MQLCVGLKSSSFCQEIPMEYFKHFSTTKTTYFTTMEKYWRDNLFTSLYIFWKFPSVNKYGKLGLFAWSIWVFFHGLCIFVTIHNCSTKTYYDNTSIVLLPYFNIGKFLTFPLENLIIKVFYWCWHLSCTFWNVYSSWVHCVVSI